MFKITRLSVASLLLASVFLVSSCKKNKDEEVDNDPTSAQDNAMAESTANDIVTIAGEASENGSAGTYRTGAPEASLLTSCATVSADSVTKIITVTFNGTVCNDGRTRSGSLYFDFSGSTNGAIHYRDPGFKCVVTSSGYVVNGNQISMGSKKTIENTTPLDFPSGSHTPANTNVTWTIVTDLSITKATGGTITWNCTRYKTLLNTSDPNVYRGTAMAINWSKARIGITGSASGVTAKGNAYTINVTNQLVRDFSACGARSHFISGTLIFSPAGKYPRNVDYGYSASGSGQCDDLIQITINGKVFIKSI